MFTRNINTKVIVGVVLLIVQAIILLSYMKRAKSVELLPLIICCIPGLIGGFMIYYEKFRGRF